MVEKVLHRPISREEAQKMLSEVEVKVLRAKVVSPSPSGKMQSTTQIEVRDDKGEMRTHPASQYALHLLVERVAERIGKPGLREKIEAVLQSEPADIQKMVDREDVETFKLVNDVFRALNSECTGQKTEFKTDVLANATTAALSLLYYTNPDNPR